MAFLDETTEQEVEKNKAIRGYIMRALARGNNGALLVRQIVNAPLLPLARARMI